MTDDTTITNLKHHFLLATPQLDGSLFERSVVYICSHEAEGAMGLTINQSLEDLCFEQIADDMGVASSILRVNDPIIYRGGPVEMARGFVLHSDDYTHHSTIRVGGTTCLSANSEIVSAIAGGSGPQRVTFCLGYAGWGPSQLEDEIADNSWLVVPADEAILFETALKDRYTAALARLGVSSMNVLYDNTGVA